MNPCSLCQLFHNLETWKIPSYVTCKFFSQCIRIFKSNQGFKFFLLSLVLSFLPPVSYSQPMIWQPLTGGSWAPSHMRMKARKERTRWHQKICLSRSLVVKLAIWLPAGRLWGKGWEQHSTTVREEEFCHAVCFDNLLERKNLHMKVNEFSDLTSRLTVTGYHSALGRVNLPKTGIVISTCGKRCAVFGWQLWKTWFPLGQLLSFNCH